MLNTCKPVSYKREKADGKQLGSWRPDVGVLGAVGSHASGRSWSLPTCSAAPRGEGSASLILERTKMSRIYCAKSELYRPAGFPNRPNTR
jgi:hypothetical protein